MRQYQGVMFNRTPRTPRELEQFDTQKMYNHNRPVDRTFGDGASEIVAMWRVKENLKGEQVQLYICRLLGKDKEVVDNALYGQVIVFWLFLIA